MVFGVLRNQIQIPFLLNNCVAVDKLPYLFEFLFPYLQGNIMPTLLS